MSFVRERMDDFILVENEGFICSESSRLQRHSSTGSLYSSNSINDCTFDVIDGEVEQVESSQSADELREIYYDSTSLITKSRVLVKLSAMHGNHCKMGDHHSVGQKLNSVLRLFTKDKVVDTGFEIRGSHSLN